MEKKSKTIKTQALFEISILLVATIAFSWLISPVSAAEINVCCEKTKSGIWCQNDLPANCDASYESVPTSCQATSFCNPGCCFDSNEGICMESTPQKVCNQNNGTWANDAECNIQQCAYGCCVLGTQASFVSLTRCKKLSALYGLKTNFLSSVDNEVSCIAIAASQDEGACAFDRPDDIGGTERTCLFTTRGECSEIDDSEFYLNYLCSAEELGTNCGPTQDTMCVEGKVEVYFKDSCGNPANVYDASRVRDKSYWKEKIRTDEISCDNGKGNIESKNCGTCDYFKGSICGNSKEATYGDFVCKDLNCYDTQNGNNYKNGESWCIYQSATGNGSDAVGSRHFRHVCMNGEEIIEPCADYRAEVCLESQTKLEDGTFNEAACRLNRWTDCVDQDEKDDCLNTDKRDCYWYNGLHFTGLVKKEVSSTTSGNTFNNPSSTFSATERPLFGSDDDEGEDGSGLQLGGGACLPNVPKGLAFWGEGDAASICSLGNSKCVVEYEDKILGDPKPTDNEECLTPGHIEKLNDICTSLGDCGAYVNIAGKFTNKGYKVGGSADDLPTLGDISGKIRAKAKPNPILGHVIESSATVITGGFFSNLPIFNIVEAFFNRLGLATGMIGVFGQTSPVAGTLEQIYTQGDAHYVKIAGQTWKISDQQYKQYSQSTGNYVNLEGSTMTRVETSEQINPTVTETPSETNNIKTDKRATIMTSKYTTKSGEKIIASVDGAGTTNYDKVSADGKTTTRLTNEEVTKSLDKSAVSKYESQALKNAFQNSDTQLKDLPNNQGHWKISGQTSSTTNGQTTVSKTYTNELTGETVTLSGKDTDKAATAFKQTSYATANQQGGSNLMSSAMAGITKDLTGTLMLAGMAYGIVAAIKGKDAGIAAAAAVAGGKIAMQIADEYGGTVGKYSGLIGIGVGVAIFILMYKETEYETVEFTCEPYEPPIGGSDCELCNNYEECTEYTCKSLGQACQIVPGENGNGVCTWVNPHDTKSPGITPWAQPLTKGLKYTNAKARPAGEGGGGGMKIVPESGGECLEAFTPLKFGIITMDSNGEDEPAQCKIDSDVNKSFEKMTYYVGETSAFKYNHTQTMALPGPANLAKEAPELENDGKYKFYIRCQDANGNQNHDAFTVEYCVNPGPDETAPLIVQESIPSGFPINYNRTNVNVSFYINEPAECKWSREDKDYTLMENEMDCDTSLRQVQNINNNYVYECKTFLNGLENRKENSYYIRCKDQPLAQEADRNTNTQSFRYTLMGTQPLNILDIKPNETVSGATDAVSVYLEVKTDNGYSNGEATCSFSQTENEDDYVEFKDTGTNEHKQMLVLAEGSYTYYIKCVDLGNNVEYNSTTFYVDSDMEGPIVVRAYKDAGKLKIVTIEKAECRTSDIDCNFDLDQQQGVLMDSYDNLEHFAEWKTQTYYIRCKDEYNNQPEPNSCSVIVKPFDIIEDSGAIDL